MKILEGINLTKIYKSGWIGGRRVIALNNVTISLGEGESLSIIGESGAGKTTLAKVLLGITAPTEGKVVFNGKDVTGRIPRELRRLMGYIPQHPESALDPRWRLYDSIVEPLKIHGIDKREREDQIEKLLEMVSLDYDILQRRPHEVSGGELQRAVIASSLITNPILLICDEPTSMLDVSTQADILRLIKSLKGNLSYLFISHDVRVASFMGEKIAVMLSGSIVELAPARELIKNPLHPYTEVLVGKREDRIETSVESRGCPFYGRCPYRMPTCKEEVPRLRKVEGGHYVACHRYRSYFEN